MDTHKAEPPGVTPSTHGKVPHSSRGAQLPQQPGMHQRRQPVRHTVAQTGLAAGSGHRRSRAQHPVDPACCGIPGRVPWGQQGSHILSCFAAAGPPGSPGWDSHLVWLLHSRVLSPPASYSQRPAHWQLGPHPVKPGRPLVSR